MKILNPDEVKFINYLLMYSTRSTQRRVSNALEVLKEYRGQKIPKMFFDYLQNKNVYDYLWGRQSKKLNNLSFWSQYRVVFDETATHYFTMQKLKPSVA